MFVTCHICIRERIREGEVYVFMFVFVTCHICVRERIRLSEKARSRSRINVMHLAMSIAIGISPKLLSHRAGYWCRYPIESYSGSVITRHSEIKTVKTKDRHIHAPHNSPRRNLDKNIDINF